MLAGDQRGGMEALRESSGSITREAVCEIVPESAEGSTRIKRACAKPATVEFAPFFSFHVLSDL